ENFRVPVNEPGDVGLKDTGTLRLLPAANVTGSFGAVAANGAAVETAVTVTERVAVTVAVAAPECATVTLPKLVCGAVNADVVGCPNPYTFPSLVPTYTRPPAVVGVLNFTAVPIAKQRSSLR